MLGLHHDGAARFWEGPESPDRNDREEPRVVRSGLPGSVGRNPTRRQRYQPKPERALRQVNSACRAYRAGKDL
jgi:hypothetical protein